MNTYYLTQNMLYDCKHIVKKRWYHSILGEPSLCLDQCFAKNKAIADKKFRLMGYNFGIFH